MYPQPKTACRGPRGSSPSIAGSPEAAAPHSPSFLASALKVPQGLSCLIPLSVLAEADTATTLAPACA